MILRNTDPARSVSLSDQRPLGEKAVDGSIAGEGPEFRLGKACIRPERKHYPLDSDVFRGQDFFLP